MIVVKNVTIDRDTNIKATFKSDTSYIVSKIESPPNTFGIRYDKGGNVGTLINEFTTGLLKNIGAYLYYIVENDTMNICIMYNNSHYSELSKYNAEIYLNDIREFPDNFSMENDNMTFSFDYTSSINEFLRNTILTVKVILVKK